MKYSGHGKLLSFLTLSVFFRISVRHRRTQFAGIIYLLSPLGGIRDFAVQIHIGSMRAKLKSRQQNSLCLMPYNYALIVNGQSYQSSPMRATALERSPPTLRASIQFVASVGTVSTFVRP
jgi:hypothetical protein